MEYFEGTTSPLREVIESGSQAALSAVHPLLKFLTLALFGFVLSQPKIDLIPKATLNILTKLLFALLLPCLIFTSLGPTITLPNLLQWWFIPFNVLLSTALGSLLGLAVALLSRPPPQFFRFTVIAVAFGNTGNLALAVIASTCHARDTTPFGPTCLASGVAYVALSQWASSALVYTLVYHIMEPPSEHHGVAEEPESSGESSATLLVEAEWPGMEEKQTLHCKTPLVARAMAEPRKNILRRIGTVAERTPVRHILSPPTIASLLAIAIGAVPWLKDFVFEEDSPCAVLTDSLRILSEAMVPAAMLILGGMLAEGPRRSGLGVRTTVGIIVARLVVLPLVGIGVVGLADRLGFLVAGDRMFRFVVLLQYTTPSAILLGAVASLRGYAVKEASAVLFWQHVVAVFSFSFYVIVYFKLLLS